MKLFKLLFLGLIVIFFAIDSYASGLRVTPYRIHLKAKDRVMSVTLNNSSDSRKAYRISFETRYMTPAGGSVEVDKNSEFSAIPYLRVSPRRVVLGANERQTIRLQVRAKGMKDGDYFTHLKFTEVKIPLSLEEIEKQKQEAKNKGMSFKIEEAINVAVPVTVSYGNVKSEVKILSVEKNGFMQGETEFLDVKVKRSGNGQGKGFFYGRFKSNEAKEDADYEIIVNRAPLNVYRNLNEFLARVPINSEVPLKNGKLILTLHEGEGINSPVIDTFKLEL